MGVGAGLYMYVVVVQKFTFTISSPDEFLFLHEIENASFLYIHPGKDYFIGTPRIFIPVFFTENEIKNASFLDASMFNPMFQSENGKLCHSVKPCLEYDDVTGIQFYCASK